jgi:hypothetical protein
VCAAFALRIAFAANGDTKSGAASQSMACVRHLHCALLLQQMVTQKQELPLNRWPRCALARAVHCNLPINAFT